MENTSLTTRHFNNADEWRIYIAEFQPNRGYYNPQPSSMYPRSFPCLMVYDPEFIVYRQNHNDEFYNFFLYEGEYQQVEA
jgi:hypothetical protein